MAMFGWLQVVIVGIPVLFLVSGNPTASFFLQSAMIFVLCMSMLSLIFVPKIIILKNRNGGKLWHARSVTRPTGDVVESARAGITVITSKNIAECGFDTNRRDRNNDDTIRDLHTQLGESHEMIRLLEEQLNEKERNSEANIRDLRALLKQSQERIRTLERGE